MLDLIKDKNRIDTGIFSEAIKLYFGGVDKDLLKLSKYAICMNMEEQLKTYTEVFSEESCAGCSHSGSCESQKQNAGNTAPSKAPANVGSQVKKVIGVISGKGGVGKSLEQLPWHV